MKALAAVLIFAACSSQVFSSTPRSCRIHDCPQYTVIETKNGYEVRQYETSYWVVTEMARENEMWEDRSKSRESFRKLLNYIKGDNEAEMQMNMTAPVLGVHQRDNVQRGFMIPLNIGASSAPKPSDSTVSLLTLQPFQVYVRSFGGWPYGIFNNANYFKHELELLKSDLKRDSVDFTEEKFFTASYDSPYTLFWRRNEVMIPKN